LTPVTCWSVSVSVSSPSGAASSSDCTSNWATAAPPMNSAVVDSTNSAATAPFEYVATTPTLYPSGSSAWPGAGVSRAVMMRVPPSAT
jgi:hypothetical protein